MQSLIVTHQDSSLLGIVIGLAASPVPWRVDHWGDGRAKERLIQFGAHRGLPGSHIGGHIIYFYNISAGEITGAAGNVWEGSDEEMGPVTGLVYRRVPREGSQSAVGGVHRSTAESIGAVAQGASPPGWDRGD